jgi:AraC family transcriptional regulator of adaptative response/methylated-DNA-[protein]-cysteine methyltransferase
MIADEGRCWSAVARRDAAADGDFVYAVVTTGIYCRPSCPTPTPLRRNVRFFSDPAAAGSISRAYENARKVLGMTPAAWRAGGAGTGVRFAITEQDGGLVLVAATGEGLCAIEFGDDAAKLEARLRRRLPAAVIDRLDANATARVAIAMRHAELPPLALGLAADVREVALRARLRNFLGQGLSARPQSRVGQLKAAWPVRLPASSESAPALADGG